MGAGGGGQLPATGAFLMPSGPADVNVVQVLAVAGRSENVQAQKAKPRKGLRGMLLIFWRGHILKR